MKLIWKYLKEYKKLLMLTLVLATINQIFSLLDPQVFRLLVDNYINKAQEMPRSEFIYGVLFLLFLMILVALISRLAKNFQDYYVNIITQKVGTNLYADSLTHALSIPYRSFEDQKSGEMLQKLQKGRTDVENLIMSLINILFLSLVGMLFVFAYTFLVNWLICLAFLIVTPLLAATIFLISGKIKSAQKNINREMTSLAGSTTETIRNIELVKSLGLENQEIARLNKVNDQILNLNLKKIKLIRILSFIQGTLINASRGAILFLMLWLIYNQSISLGEFFSIFFYLFFIFSPLGEFGNLAAQYQEAKASVEQLETILKIPPQSKSIESIKIEKINSIELKNVSFGYNSNNKLGVNNINLIIAPGETVAFVGPSGSGKTTLIKLLVGLYKPQQGELLFSGNNAENIDYDYLRSKIGLVSQETQLFAGTILDNLLFVKPDAKEAECLMALKEASLMGIVEKGDKGLHTIIGEGGLKLSGGERQRLAIARALLRKPDLLIFDEATSSLDTLTEKEISQTIKQIANKFPQLITVLIAHRLSTVAQANKIYVLAKGSIIEAGNHDNLVKAKGLYASLWHEQSMIDHD